MHGPIRGDLENLLAGKPEAPRANEHLAGCPECGSELSAMQHHSQLFKCLRAGEEMEPSGGFYARVMQRIEERAKRSMWAVFVYSPFGKRLALASFSVALILSSYVVAQEKFDGHLLAESAVGQVHYDAPMEGDQAQQRDAVLENFAAHEGESK